MTLATFINYSAYVGCLGIVLTFVGLPFGYRAMRLGLAVAVGGMLSAMAGSAVWFARI